MNNIFSLNSIWDSIGISNLSFLGFLKRIFLIIFIILNICFLYLEYLDILSKNKSKSSTQYMESGVAVELRRIAAGVVVGIGLYSGYITIRNDFVGEGEYQKKLEELKNELAKAKLEAKKAADEKSANNFIQKMHFDGISRSLQTVEKLRSDKSELMKLIEEKSSTAKFKAGEDDTIQSEVRKYKLRLYALELEEKRAHSELSQTIESGHKFATEVTKEPDESKLLSFINEDLKNSTFFNLDELFSNFESLNGITKLVVLMMGSSYVIL